LVLHSRGEGAGKKVHQKTEWYSWKKNKKNGTLSEGMTEKEKCFAGGCEQKPHQYFFLTRKGFLRKNSETHLAE